MAGPRMFPGWPGPMMMQPGVMMYQVPAIAVAGGKIYVVQNGVLYKFDAASLRLEKQTRFIVEPPPPPPGMPPRPPAPMAPPPGAGR